MLPKSSICLVLLVLITLYSSAQVVTKIKRKGVVVKPVKNSVPAPSNYSFEQLRGKWQEISRTDRSGSPVTFQDTLCYHFSGKDQVFSRDGVNMDLKGSVTLDPGNVLVAAADVFTIKSLNNNQMVLDDGEKYIHTLIRKNKFWHETLPTSSVVPETFTNPIQASIESLAGRWIVYRRDASPGTTDPDKALIRELVIPSDNNASGQITFYLSDKSLIQPCNFSLHNERIKIITEGHSWNMNVYKADTKEFVFGDGSIMYFCKPI